MNHLLCNLSLCGLLILMQPMSPESQAQTSIRPPLYDEAKVPRHKLPSVLHRADGSTLTDVKQWADHRTYLLNTLAKHEYGFAPKDSVTIDSKLIEQGPFIESGTARPSVTRKQIRITLERNGKKAPIDLLLFVPTDAKGSVPCFVLLNFEGNQSVSTDPNIPITTVWRGNGVGVIDNHATEASRGSEQIRFPIEMIVGRGYAVATAYYGDIDPDFDDGFKNGVHALYPEFVCDEDHPDRWGSVATWAWGMSRIADVLEKDSSINANQLFVVGHSRLGKAALWAGATDERFKIVYSNNSGCGGAAIKSRCFGESIARINTSFPHWFCRNFRQFNDAEEKLTFDQHMLVASIAPRRVYIASASEDLWADPRGEMLAGVMASPAFELNGLPGLESEQLPAPGQSIGSRSIGFHLREGKHELMAWDWERFLDFAAAKP